MIHELECPHCHHKFTVEGDYGVGDCPNCDEGHYYWDYVVNEYDCEELFAGYYWEIVHPI